VVVAAALVVEGISVVAAAASAVEGMSVVVEVAAEKGDKRAQSG
jgi:hypothetical protein